MPKLPKGMFRRGPSFYVRLWQEGQDRWVCLGEDYQEARRKLRGLRRGECPVRAGSSVRDVAERWLKLYVPTARGEKQARMSGSRVRKYLAEFLGHQPLVAVKPDDIRGYRLWLEGQGLKPLTVLHLLADARCFFNWCVDMGLVDRSPFPRRVMPRVQEQPPDRLTDEEVEAVLGIPEPHAFVAAWRWARACGGVS